MKKVVRLFFSALLLLLPFIPLLPLISACCSTSGPEYADSEKYMYQRKEKFWVHGYTDRRGYEHTTEMVISHWLVEGHDYIGGVNGYFNPSIHDPECRLCTERRDSLYNETVNALKEYVDSKVDSLATVCGQKTNEVKSLINKKAKELKYYWDNPPIDYD